MFDLFGFGHMLLSGTWVTVQLALISLAIGMVFSVLGAAMKLSEFWVLRFLAGIYITLFRGVPELVVILFIYFGGVVIVNALAGYVGHDSYVGVSAFVAGVAALSLTFGAYGAEILRAAIQAVPKGQVEAARACGMRSITIGWRIVLPQVWRFALPGLGNTFLIILKETALVSVIGLNELMRQTDIAVGYTKQPFTFFLTAAFIYLGLTAIAMLIQRKLEQHANRGVIERSAA